MRSLLLPKKIIQLASIIVVCISSLNCLAQRPPIINDSITVAVAPGYDSVGSFHRFWLGESYRKLWAAPVKMKVFHVSKEKGGLTIVQMGGGLQTKSIRLKDSRGREWVLRTIQKFPERGLPENLRATIVKDILRDQVVTGHPYGALTVPPLAQALGIRHTSPQVVYVADDTAFGKFRTEFANSVLLFEEREPTDTLRTVNTDKVQEKLEEDNDASIDQKLVLRARLLDMLIGDWDRHEDQWRWERKKEKNETIYTPIPRDRDKVFYNTTGVLPWFLSHQWLKSNLQSFGDEIRDIKGYNFNNRYFDRYFLTRLDEDDWKEQIQFVAETTTDSLIRSAVRLMPDTIWKLSGRAIEETLIKRRKNLQKNALEYYKFISKYVDIPATAKHELFQINYAPKGSVGVAIFKTKKDGTKDKLIFKRVFKPHVTKEIRLYGIAGNNVFSVTGSEHSTIKIRMIGGENKDSFYVDKATNNRKKLLVYDRLDQQNSIPKAGAKIRTSTDSTITHFRKKTFKYDQLGPTFMVQYNLDQGVQLRAGLLYQKQGFRKEPYASRHELFGFYSTGRKSLMFSYAGDLKNIFGKTDLTINVLSRGPHNISNFFGVGNETQFLKTTDKKIDYYRNRYDYINTDVRLKWNINNHFRVSTGLAGQFYTAGPLNNTKRFLKEYDIANLDKKVFADRYYAGVVAGADLDTRNESMLPGKGIYWAAETQAMQQINGGKNTYARLSSHIDFYIPVSKQRGIVLATRVGGGTTLGKPAFFQQMQLGGVQNLRGFHSSRFTGKSMFYHNAELRAKLFNFTSYLFPGTVGVIAFNDVGRVWVPGESSKKWHDGYGGGLYIVPADLVLIQVLIGHSKEGTQPYITFGFSF